LQAVEIRLEEALDNLKEAVEFYLDNAITLGIIKDADTAFTSTHKIASTFDVTDPGLRYTQVQGIRGAGGRAMGCAWMDVGCRSIW